MRVLDLRVDFNVEEVNNDIEALIGWYKWSDTRYLNNVFHEVFGTNMRLNQLSSRIYANVEETAATIKYLGNWDYNI